MCQARSHQMRPNFFLVLYGCYFVDYMIWSEEDSLLAFSVYLFKIGVITSTLCSTITKKHLSPPLPPLIVDISFIHSVCSTCSSLLSQCEPDSFISLNRWKRCCQLASLWYGATCKEKTVQSSASEFTGVTGVRCPLLFSTSDFVCIFYDTFSRMVYT